MELLLNLIIAVGAGGTLIGAFLVYKTLVSNHDWQRREYALNLVKEWNENTSGHWQAIENKYPHLRDVDRTGGEVTELTKQQAKDIYTCEPSDEECWKIRYHFIELLNYLEYVGMSYTQNVSDHKIIEACLKDAMIKYHDILINVIDVIDTCEGYLSWEPYIKLVENWKTTYYPSREKTA